MYGRVGYGMAWHGMVWYGMVRHGMAWYDIQPNLAISKSVNSPLFRTQAESPWFDRYSMLTRLFRNPAISNIFFMSRGTSK